MLWQEQSTLTNGRLQSTQIAYYVNWSSQEYMDKKGQTKKACKRDFNNSLIQFNMINCFMCVWICVLIIELNIFCLMIYYNFCVVKMQFKNSIHKQTKKNVNRTAHETTDIYIFYNVAISFLPKACMHTGWGEGVSIFLVIFLKYRNVQSHNISS